MKPLIFILEDDPDVARTIERVLNAHGFVTSVFRRRADLDRQIKREKPVLCLVDLSLPDGDGLEIVSSLLRPQKIPSIIVTARGELSDRVIGLEVGADDYMSKPFEPRELVARVRAVLRRGQTQSDTGEGRSVVSFAGWQADFSACSLRDPDGNLEPLSSAEARLLKIFVMASGRVLSRAQLLDLESPDVLEPEDRSMDARISRLRKKLHDDPRNPRMIRTVYGAGYVFTARAEWSS